VTLPGLLVKLGIRYLFLFDWDSKLDGIVPNSLVMSVLGFQFDLKEAVKVLICSGCLGDRSDDANEIVECDGCGVTVHEGKEICNHILYLCLFYIYFLFVLCLYT
jgi:hypothetical protein